MNKTIAFMMHTEDEEQSKQFRKLVNKTKRHKMWNISTMQQREK